MNNASGISSEHIQAASQTVNQLRDEISKAVVGQSSVIEQVIIALLASGHVLIEGVPGLGKTLLVRAMAKTFNGIFSRIHHNFSETSKPIVKMHIFSVEVNLKFFCAMSES